MHTTQHPATLKLNSKDALFNLHEIAYDIPSFICRRLLMSQTLLVLNPSSQLPFQFRFICLSADILVQTLQRNTFIPSNVPDSHIKIHQDVHVQKVCKCIPSLRNVNSSLITKIKTVVNRMKSKILTVSITSMHIKQF